MRVTPIIAPILDWGEFVNETHRVLGRSPTASLQVAGIKPGLIRTIPAALGEFQVPGTPAVPFLRNPGHVLDHLHVSLMIEGDPLELASLMRRGKLVPLAPTDSDRLVILTGSLRDWRDVLHATPTREIREVFVRAGLADAIRP